MPTNSNLRIPKNIADIDNEGLDIPSIVAVSESIKDYENEKVVFSFESYNNSRCQIDKLAKPESKKLTKELKKISSVLIKHFISQDSSGIACKPVQNSGNYSVLFNDIPEDTELLEIDYTGAGRIFGYLSKNIFNIIAINKIHR
jgi:hypothetical protein